MASFPAALLCCVQQPGSPVPSAGSGPVTSVPSLRAGPPCHGATLRVRIPGSAVGVLGCRGCLRCHSGAQWHQDLQDESCTPGCPHSSSTCPHTPSEGATGRCHHCGTCGSLGSREGPGHSCPPEGHAGMRSVSTWVQRGCGGLATQPVPAWGHLGAV